MTKPKAKPARMKAWEGWAVVHKRQGNLAHLDHPGTIPILYVARWRLAGDSPYRLARVRLTEIPRKRT